MKWAWFAPLAASLLATPALAQRASASDANAFIEWAREHAVPLPECSPQSASNALQATGAIVGNARVVALGEPAHGAHEPLAFRNCLFRYLVEHHGFTAIAIESGLNESRRLQDYLSGGAGDARQLAREGLSWGFWRFGENVELIEWIHVYNADPRHERKIHLYGIDMSGGERSGEWRNARVTLDDSIAYLMRVAPQLSASSVEAIKPFVGRFTQPGYTALPAAEQVRLQSAILNLTRFFDREKAGLVAASSERDWAWARRNLVLARQLEAMFRVSRVPSTGDDLQPDDYKADAVRDTAMADNLEWVLEQEGKTGRVLLFAHNGHIVNAPTRGGIWSIYRHPPKSMGQHLRVSLKQSIMILGTSAGRNGPGLPPDDREAGTVDRALEATGIEHFLLDLRAGTESSAAGWIEQEQTLRSNFTSENIIVPESAIDAVVFFERLNATRQ
ncbi:erythromycin esterase [Sphingomonas sp. DBB INV C78]|uniref:erythromycin esterase family protein n=1 Tax=Sphingomonas sp. DBB INV C78 TaxID=3349434 RepID=UPI0036D27355